MFKNTAVGIFIVESPLHCGIGQDIGIIDQPLQRERHTNYPQIQASEIKGVFRQYYKGNNADEIFGPEKSGEEGGDFASAVSFGDARILFFPVKSLKGTYVWITSKDVLEKFTRTLNMAKIELNVPSVVDISDEQIIVNDKSLVVDNDKVVLEEYIFTRQATPYDFTSIVDAIIPDSVNGYQYLNDSLKKKICVVSNDIFREFTEMSTEIITRIKIKQETGVVEPGALWTEEYLPTDTILYFPVFTTDSRKSKDGLMADKVLECVKTINSYIQIGGNETVGKGFVRVTWVNGGV